MLFLAEFPGGARVFIALLLFCSVLLNCYQVIKTSVQPLERKDCPNKFLTNLSRHRKPALNPLLFTRTSHGILQDNQ